eukprot:518803_1
MMWQISKILNVGVRRPHSCVRVDWARSTVRQLQSLRPQLSPSDAPSMNETPLVNGVSPYASGKMTTHESDVLVMGCGVAGTSAALKAAESGLKVTMLSASSSIRDCNSWFAQGGIIYKGGENDSSKHLEADVRIAGAGICDPHAVKQLAVEGPRRVEELLLDSQWVKGIPFDRDDNGELKVCLEACHSEPRIIYSSDRTGLAVTKGLQSACLSHPNIEILSGRVGLDFAMAHPSYGKASQCVGAHVLRGGVVGEPSSVETFYAPATILATGGLGEIYAHTTNPPSSRGDGIAMAYRAGAKLSNMEYVQFHPTTLHIPGERSYLLTEALRGAGAKLIDHSGRQFARDYHDAGELAPRDVVSRMIVFEMARTGKDNMLLDISHMDSDWLVKRFPGVHKHCLSMGLDICKDVLPIIPAAHYSCGGVATDLIGQTNIPGLFAAGEVACTGLHGANRLASTSLLECIVWGSKIAEYLSSKVNHGISSRHGTVLDELSHKLSSLELASPQLSLPAPASASWKGSNPTSYCNSSVRMDEMWSKLKDIMFQHIGVLRTMPGLVAAQPILRSLHEEAEMAYSSSPPCETTISLRNATTVGALVGEAAISNPSCVGTHYILSDSDVGMNMGDIEGFMKVKIYV